MVASDRVTRKLRTLHTAKTTDGEAFAILTNNPSVSYSVKLDVIPIEADQGTSPFLMEETHVDGVEFETHGNVVAYHLLKEHPGYKTSLSDQSIRVPANYMIHWYRSDRPEQHRGIPELTPALRYWLR